jgi:hypothetical protein
MEPSMRRLVIVGFLVIVAVSGCASTKATSTSARPDVAQGTVPPVSGSQSISPPPSPPAASPSQPDSSNKGSDQGSAATPPPTSTATGSSPAKTKSPADTRPVQQTGAAASHTRPPVLPPSPSSPAPTTTPAPVTSPTLNLADLEQRLRDTRAIGIFTKLSLKNQVDDLLNRFRALYRGPNKHPPVELRQRYDQLLLKVLTLLQDADPPLAAAIASSREAIWSILADPDKFAKI